MDDSIPQDGPDQILPASNFKTWRPDGAVKMQISGSDVNAPKPISVYTFFKKAAERFGDSPALAIKKNGIWKYWSYREYFDASCTVAKAFIKLGLERFHGVCIMGYNCPEWLFANFGCIFSGGLAAGVYTTNSPEACRHMAYNCRAQIVVVENEELLNKFLAVKESLPHIKVIIQWTGVSAVSGVLSWSELMDIGMRETDEELQKRLSLAAINQCCSLIYTSGTTGFPKGVMCSQDHFTWVGQLSSRGLEGSTISYLPMSHTVTQISHFAALGVRRTIYFAQPDALRGSLIDTMVEIQPTTFFGVPRVWEKIYEKIQKYFQTASPMQRDLLEWARQQARNYYDALLSGRQLSSSDLSLYSLAQSLVFNRIKESVGLLRCKAARVGAAPMSTELMEYFMSIDIPLHEGYGMSENMSYASWNLLRPKHCKLGSAGKIRENTKMVLLDFSKQPTRDKEICFKGRSICMGYLGMPDETNKTIDDEGLLHTGDIGYLDDEGFLFITGRLKELVITAGGENVPPVMIEEAIKKELPFVNQAMLVGDRRKYLTILLTLKEDVDPQTGLPLGSVTQDCLRILEQIGSNAKTVAEVRNEVDGRPDGPLARAIRDGLDRYNRRAISNAQKVQKFAILPHHFSQATKELGDTMKLKRHVVLAKYRHLIDAMYDDTREILKSKI